MKYEINEKSFTRINNDTNGNPRYVLHFTNLITNEERDEHSGQYYNVGTMYDIAVKKANKVGGRRYNTKKYGGGIVFQCYNIQNLIDKLQEI